MGTNVNTIPSSNNMDYSIRWVSFESNQNEIDAKKLKIEGKGKLPNVGKVGTTYIVEKNGLWERCIKQADKLRRIAGATIKDKAKAKRCKERIEAKYEKELSAEEKRDSITKTSNKEISAKQRRANINKTNSNDKEVI